MKNITLIGRILYALPFAIFGLNHFIMVDFYTGMMTTLTPGGGFTVMLTGLVMILLAGLIIAKKYVKLAGIVLAFLLLMFIVTIHIPNLFNPENFDMSLVNLLKDTSLLGGTLMIVGVCDRERKEESEA